MTDAFDGYRRNWEEVDRRINNKRWVATAIVTDVRQKDRKIRVTFLPHGDTSGWIRVLWFNSGPNYMTGQLPEVNSEVVCLFIEGQRNGCFVLGGGFLEESANAPALNGDNDFIIYDKYGSKIKFEAGGITVDSIGTLNIKAPTIKLNNGTMPVARVGDQVDTPTGPGTIVAGNNSVLA